MVTLVLSENRVSGPSAGAVAVAVPPAEAVHSLRCERCDVTWRGSRSMPCWCCGAPGAVRGEVRIFAD